MSASVQAGASRLGRGIAQLLVAAGEPVVDVPAKLAARARLLGTRSARKTDLADACSVATAALHHRRLRPVALEDHTDGFRLLSDRRDDLVAERTRTLSRLHVLPADCTLAAATADSRPPGRRPAAPDHPMTVVDLERQRIARELLADVRRLDRQITTAGRAIRAPVRENGTTLSEVYGSARCWLPSWWATMATSSASPTAITSPAAPAPHRWRPPAGMSAGSG